MTVLGLMALSRVNTGNHLGVAETRQPAPGVRINGRQGIGIAIIQVDRCGDPGEVGQRLHLAVQPELVGQRGGIPGLPTHIEGPGGIVVGGIRESRYALNRALRREAPPCHRIFGVDGQRLLGNDTLQGGRVFPGQGGSHMHRGQAAGIAVGDYRGVGPTPRNREQAELSHPELLQHGFNVLGIVGVGQRVVESCGAEAVALHTDEAEFQVAPGFAQEFQQCKNPAAGTGTAHEHHRLPVAVALIEVSQGAPRGGLHGLHGGPQVIEIILQLAFGMAGDGKQQAAQQ